MTSKELHELVGEAFDRIGTNYKVTHNHEDFVAKLISKIEAIHSLDEQQKKVVDAAIFTVTRDERFAHVLNSYDEMMEDHGDER